MPDPLLPNGEVLSGSTLRMAARGIEIKAPKRVRVFDGVAGPQGVSAETSFRSTQRNQSDSLRLEQ